jgi:hypothetical protein
MKNQLKINKTRLSFLVREKIYKTLAIPHLVILRYSMTP